jgi:hypothetical protein
MEEARLYHSYCRSASSNLRKCNIYFPRASRIRQPKPHQRMASQVEPRLCRSLPVVLKVVDRSRRKNQNAARKMVASFAKAASNPPLLRKVRSSAPRPQLIAERCVPPRLHPVVVTERTRCTSSNAARDSTIRTLRLTRLICCLRTASLPFRLVFADQPASDPSCRGFRWT